MFYSKEYEPNIFWSVSTTDMFWSEIINSNYINAEMNQILRTCSEHPLTDGQFPF